MIPDTPVDLSAGRQLRSTTRSRSNTPVYKEGSDDDDRGDEEGFKSKKGKGKGRMGMEIRRVRVRGKVGKERRMTSGRRRVEIEMGGGRRGGGGSRGVGGWDCGGRRGWCCCSLKVHVGLGSFECREVFV